MQDRARVLEALRVSARDVTADRLLDVRREVSDEPRAVLGPAPTARRARREHEALEGGPAVEHVLQGEHSTPRASEHVDTVEPERLSHTCDFVHEAVEGPQRSISRTAGPPAPELIVEHDAPPVRESLELFEVVVGKSRAAMEAEERRAGTVANAPVPDSPATDIDVTLFVRGRIVGRATTAPGRSELWSPLDG